MTHTHAHSLTYTHTHTPTSTHTPAPQSTRGLVDAHVASKAGVRLLAGGRALLECSPHVSTPAWGGKYDPPPPPKLTQDRGTPEQRALTRTNHRLVASLRHAHTARSTWTYSVHSPTHLLAPNILTCLLHSALPLPLAHRQAWTARKACEDKGRQCRGRGEAG